MSIHHNDDQILIDMSPPNNTFAPIVPPRLQTNMKDLKPSVGTKLEDLLLNSDSDSDFDPRADEQIGSKNSNDLFGFEPSNTSSQQAFDFASFSDEPASKFSSHTSPPPLRTEIKW